MAKRCFWIVVCLTLGFCAAPPSQGQRVYKDSIEPNWIADRPAFWYRNELPSKCCEFILVDTAKGLRAKAFDHERLAQALREAGFSDVTAVNLPIDWIEFQNELQAIAFTVEGRAWRCDLEDYSLSQLDEAQGKSTVGIQPLPADSRPRASGRSTHETYLTFENAMDFSVQLFWLSTDRRTVSYATIAPGETHRQHTFSGHVWEVRKDGGRPIAVYRATRAPATAIIDREIEYVANRASAIGRSSRSRDTSPPDGLGIRQEDGHLFLENSIEKNSLQLTQQKARSGTFGQYHWSPGGRYLIAFNIVPGDEGQVHLIESSPKAGGRAQLRSRVYPLPGDRFTSYQPLAFDVERGEQLKLELEPFDFGRPRLRWLDDERFVVEKIDRGHQRFRLIEVDLQAMHTRSVIDEVAETFIWTAHTERLSLPRLSWLPKNEQLVYVSERSGFRHLYLVDVDSGQIKPITQGEFVVRGIDRIDADAGQIWFRASGFYKDQDPYLIHYFRVDIDGENLVPLTAAHGQHEITFSPSEDCFIDRFSRVDLPPVHQLRRTSDGKLLCELERADTSELEAAGWRPPEVYVAKGRDGETDIWGIICRPRDLDPQKSYPIIEDIYAGPHGSFVPKTFSAAQRYREFTDQGFIVVKIDGMGTANRSKRFHDVCWHNLKDAGFPDRVQWIRAASKDYTYMDPERVGIYGTSAGGQNAAAALLFFNDFYKVAVASCGCHDNRMDKASWNEQWMGYPVGPQYAANSNIENAHLLRGSLMLIVGELDSNVPPESTLRFADALIRADKDFEFLLIPGMGHSDGGRYGRRRRLEFFRERLKP